MLTAITRKVSPGLAACELTFLDRQEIDLAKAMEQHGNYEACLAELGTRVISLPADPLLPDSMFVEDPAIVVEEVAVITRPGAASRRRETNDIAIALQPFRELRRVQEPATLEGGDVMRIGKTLYVGRSRRTNDAGIAHLGDFLKPFGYEIVPVEVRGCLHLKSAVSYLGDQTILVNREWIDVAALAGFRTLEVAEPGGANVLRVGETLVASTSFPRTADLLEEAGFRVRRLDVSELHKAEAGLTCTSLLFDDGT